ncbi:MAG: polysaccharide pyruvyl transferase family protein [Oscillospiraceae bacterium]|nr:polysaccharide pyruvyl transferase family protein [Oscillospiraceae bacterium]
MKRVYLCGHTGSNNRGCEAIIRSTISVLRDSGVDDCQLFSYNAEHDRRRGLDEVVPISSYEYSPKIVRGIYRYLLNDPVKVHKDAYQKIIRKGMPDYLVCVGGDTYCFAHPYGNYAINYTGQKHRIPTVLWGCSIDERILTNDTLKQDIQKYSYILARESLTYEILKQCVKPEQTLLLACDPAFHLESRKTELPAVFGEGDTIGINLSPYFVSRNEGEMILQNVHNLIRYILEETDFGVCFIPHVFSYEKADQDIEVLDCMYEKYMDEPRIGFLRNDLSCTQIKYVISRCRFFIGARTHSMIAAYSTGVPALALSYSIKSLGIAKDIFGTNDGYVLSKAAMEKSDCLKDTFVQNIMRKEQKIRSIYDSVMPAYKQGIIEAAKKIFTKSIEKKA